MWINRAERWKMTLPFSESLRGLAPGSYAPWNKVRLSNCWMKKKKIPTLSVSGINLEFRPAKLHSDVPVRFHKALRISAWKQFVSIIHPGAFILGYEKHSSCPKSCSPCLKCQTRRWIKVQTHKQPKERYYWKARGTTASTVSWNYVYVRNQWGSIENHSSIDDTAFIMHVKRGETYRV